MKTTIELQMRSTYGTDRIYPVNEPAKLFAKLVKKTTFSVAEIKLIQKLGFEIEWVPRSVDLKGGADET